MDTNWLCFYIFWVSRWMLCASGNFQFLTVYDPLHNGSALLGVVLGSSTLRRITSDHNPFIQLGSLLGLTVFILWITMSTEFMTRAILSYSLQADVRRYSTRQDVICTSPKVNMLFQSQSRLKLLC